MSGTQEHGSDLKKDVDTEAESSKLNLNEQIKAYLKENLNVSLYTQCGRIRVDINIGDETISSSSEYICDMINQKG